MQDLGDHLHFLLSWKFLEASGKNTGPPAWLPVQALQLTGQEPEHDSGCDGLCKCGPGTGGTALGSG